MGCLVDSHCTLIYPMVNLLRMVLQGSRTRGLFLTLTPHAFAAALVGWSSELSFRVSCGQGVCVPLTWSPQGLGHPLRQERAEEALVQWGRHKQPQDTAQSCFQGSHLGHTTDDSALWDGVSFHQQLKTYFFISFLPDIIYRPWAQTGCAGKKG